MLYERDNSLKEIIDSNVGRAVTSQMIQPKDVYPSIFFCVCYINQLKSLSSIMNTDDFNLQLRLLHVFRNVVLLFDLA